MKIYADNAATTRLSDTALAAMTPCFQEIYGNPSSLHTPGQLAAEKLAAAREVFARNLHADGRSLSPPAAARRTTRPSALPRPWGQSAESGTSSPQSSSTTRCSTPSRLWSGRNMR